MSLARDSAVSPASEASSQSDGQRHDRIPSKPTSDNVETSISQKMLSAITGSVLTSLLVTPLDVVRVRLQSQSSPSPSLPSYSADFARLPNNTGISACCREVFWVQNKSQFCVASSNSAVIPNDILISECVAAETQRRSFNSTIDGLRKIARNEGITTLWRGLSPTLAMAVPANVIYFAGYDWMRASDNSPIKKRFSDAYAPLVAGSVARVLAAVAVGPIEMLRTRMQATHPSNTGAVLRETVTGLQEMVSQSGYRSLWRGLGLTMWRDVPFSALYWWGYEYGRGALHDIRMKKQDASYIGPPMGSQNLDNDLDHKTVLIDSFVAGASSGAVAALVTTPFDVGKTRQQTFRHKLESKASGSSSMKTIPEELPMPRFLWHIFQTEGAAGLFKGWTARVGKVGFSCGLMISSYAITKRLARDMNQKEE